MHFPRLHGQSAPGHDVTQVTCGLKKLLYAGREAGVMLYHLIKIGIKDDYDIDTVVGESLQSLQEAGLIESYEIDEEIKTKKEF